MITAKDVAFYKENGYVVLHDFYDAEELGVLRRTCDELMAQARGLTKSNEFYDLEDSHTPDDPRVRRLSKPNLQHPVFFNAAREPKLMDALSALIGPDIRISHPAGKVNAKGAEYGAAVEWHQDWTNYPHTNDDLLTVGIPLDDCMEENGPVLVIPGSHKGEVYNHHVNGVYSAGMDPVECGVDLSKAVAMTGRAGMVTFHHARTIHGSALNRSSRARRLYLVQYAAVDAWPILGVSDFDKFNANIVRGKPTIVPRMEKLPVRIPYPRAPSHATLYEAQQVMAKRHFGVYEDNKKEKAGAAA